MAFSQTKIQPGCCWAEIGTVVTHLCGHQPTYHILQRLIKPIAAILLRQNAVGDLLRYYHQVQSGLDIHGLALLRSTSHIRRHYTLRTTGCSRVWHSLAWFKRGGFPKYVHCSIILQIPYRFPTLQVRQFSLKQVKGDLWIPWVNWAQAIQSTFLRVRGDKTKLFVCDF